MSTFDYLYLYSGVHNRLHFTIRLALEDSSLSMLMRSREQQRRPDIRSRNCLRSKEIGLTSREKHDN